MSKSTYAFSTRFALLTALGFAALFAASHASAGTQMPPWKWQQLSGSSTSNVAATQAVVDNGNNAGVTTTRGAESDAGSENGETPDFTGNNPLAVNSGGSGNGGMPGNGNTPEAVPSPSAVAGGLAMIGLLAGRRRRRAETMA